MGPRHKTHTHICSTLACITWPEQPSHNGRLRRIFLKRHWFSLHSTKGENVSAAEEGRKYGALNSKRVLAWSLLSLVKKNKKNLEAKEASAAFFYSQVKMSRRMRTKIKQQSENTKVIEGVEIQQPIGSRVSKCASYQSQNSIFALEVDSDIWFDKVAGQHGDPDTEVGWSTRLKIVTKLKWQPCCRNRNYTVLINPNPNYPN